MMKYEEDQAKIHQVSMYLRALSNKIMAKIITYLHGKPTPTNQAKIYTDLELDQSQVSRLLNELKHMGVVNYKKAGLFHFYSLNEAKLSEILSYCDNFIENIIKESE